MRLLNVSIENFKAVVEVEFSPAPTGATLITGKNENGKTSTLDAIAAALQGKAELPQEPIHYGRKKSKTVLDLGNDQGELELKVTHEVTVKDDKLVRTLTVENADGKSPGKPQETLNSLYSRVAFDPLAFAKAEPDDQDKVLKDLAKITEPWAELERDHAVIYSARTDKNKEAAQAKARAAGMPKHAGVPAQEASVAKLAKELADAREHNAQRAAADDRITRQEADAARAQQEVAQLEAQLTTAKAKLEREQALVKELIDTKAAMKPAVDVAPLEEKLATVEETNKKVRENLAKKAEEKRAEALEAEADVMTESLKTLEAKQQALLENAQFPVDGLGFGPLGPTLNGAPLAQCSMARRLRLSYRVGVAQNPTLKLMILRDGVYLDDESLAELDRMAQEDGFQLLVERVGNKDTLGTVVLIERGHVASATAAEE